MDNINNHNYRKVKVVSNSLLILTAGLLCFLAYQYMLLSERSLEKGFSELYKIEQALSREQSMDTIVLPESPFFSSLELYELTGSKLSYGESIPSEVRESIESMATQVPIGHINTLQQKYFFSLTQNPQFFIMASHNNAPMYQALLIQGFISLILMLCVVLLGRLFIKTYHYLRKSYPKTSPNYQGFVVDDKTLQPVHSINQRWENRPLFQGYSILSLSNNGSTITLKHRNNQNLYTKIFEHRTIISYVSHELKAPLFNFSHYLDKLNAQLKTNKQAEPILKALNFSHGYLNLVLNNMLHFEQHSTHTLPNRHSIELSTLVEEVNNLIAPSLTVNQNSLKIIFSPSVPRFINTDPTKTIQILLNLLTNANKFSSNSEIQLIVHHESEQLRFSVKDTGIGIKTAHQDKIFLPFYKAERSQDGLGLGLAISQSLANSLNGELCFKNNEPSGCIFTLSLPQEAVKKNVLFPRAVLSNTSALLLLQPTNQFSAKNLQDILTWLGIHTIKLLPSELSNVASHQFDLIISDGNSLTFEQINQLQKISENILVISNYQETLESLLSNKFTRFSSLSNYFHPTLFPTLVQMINKQSVELYQQSPNQIILIDDHSLSARAIHDQLSAIGYHVTVFHTIEQYHSSGQPLESTTLLVDLNLSDISGQAVVDTFSPLQQKGIDVLYISASPISDKLLRYIHSSHQSFVEKANLPLYFPPFFGPKPTKRETSSPADAIDSQAVLTELKAFESLLKSPNSSEKLLDACHKILGLAGLLKINSLYTQTKNFHQALRSKGHVSMNDMNALLTTLGNHIKRMQSKELIG